MVSYHEVLVAAAGSELVEACVVGVESAGGLDPELDLFGSVGGRDLSTAAGGRLSWLLRVLVERTPCCDCVRWPLMVLLLGGKYLESLA